MLDLFAIFTTGGIILWVHSPIKIECKEIITKVMQMIMSEATYLGNSMIYGALEVKWSIQRELNLIFLAAYQRILPLTYVPSLLEQVKSFFTTNYSERLLADPFAPVNDFEASFIKICRLIEEKDRDERRGKSPTPDSVKYTTSSASITDQRKVREERGKQMRNWGDKVSKDAMDSLDLSSDKSEVLTDSIARNMVSNEDFSCLKDLEEPESENNTDSGIWKYFGNLTGQREITKNDLQDAISKMRDHLVRKNVAIQVADVICVSVSETLVGKKTGTFNTVAKMVRTATELAISRILTPRTCTDLLGEIHRVRSGGNNLRPYVMAFVGVNGVGKSTNLSKVCFWLMQNNLKILLVAGDTFRSGAVEQLRTHVRNLSTGKIGLVELFERGYGKDAAAVAKDAISFARNNKFDVVMIDTAGRMQDNAPLMAALAKLVYVNKPDKLIFVGEALVGNEAVDQLRKFNSVLTNHAQGEPKLIDGVLLTKFDTIDDKVGAALSMTFIANVPILFVGVGQTYTDLRKVDVKSVVNLLFR